MKLGISQTLGYIHFSTATNSGLKKKIPLLVHSSTGQKVRQLRLNSLFKVSQSPNESVGQVGLLSGGSWEESISKLMQIVGRIQFLVVVEPRSPFLCWLSAGGHI